MHFEQLMNILSLWRDKNHDGVGYFVTATTSTAHSNTVRISVVDRAGGGDIGPLQSGNRFETGRIITRHPFICNRYN